MQILLNTNKREENFDLVIYPQNKYVEIWRENNEENWDFSNIKYTILSINTIIQDYHNCEMLKKDMLEPLMGKMYQILIKLYPQNK